MSRRVLPYGDRAVLIECADLAETQALDRWLQTRLPEAGHRGELPISEVIAGARTLLLRLSEPPGGWLDEVIATDLTEIDSVAGSASEALTIPVSYDGADLGEVADRLGLEVEEVIAAHTGQLWTVAFCGFAPGFGYLAGEDERLRVPRRSSPRTSVPAGAVGLADTWSGIYPRSGPGGWQLIGRTDRRLWDVAADPPALLQPGTRVRFEVS